MANSIYNSLRLLKPYFYSVYQIIADDVLDYEDITRRKMADEIISSYKNDSNLINYMLSDEELNILKRCRTQTFSSLSSEQRFLTDLMLFIPSYDTPDIAISKELEKSIDLALESYEKNKIQIEKDKTIFYLMVGLLRVYGVLTFRELQSCFLQLGFDINIYSYLDNPFARRFVSYTAEEDGLILDEVYSYEYDILATHPKNFKLDYDFDSLIEIGKHFFDTKNSFYQELKKNKTVSDYIDEHLDEKEIIAQCGLENYAFYQTKFFEFIDPFSEDDYYVATSFFKSLPNFYLKDEISCLSKEEAKHFFDWMLPFISYAGKIYKQPIVLDKIAVRIDAESIYNILSICAEDNFKIVDEYIKKITNKEEKEFILGLKKFVKGTFTIYKHIQDGSIFLDSNNKGYKVKGITDSLSKMSALQDIPCYCETILIPFKDQIIYGSVLQVFPVHLGPNIRKRLKNVYDKIKFNIIKKL